MKTFKALSKNALMSPYQFLMENARQIAVTAGWWKFFASLLLNRVAAQDGFMCDLLNQTTLSFMLGRPAQRGYYAKTLLHPGVPQIRDLWNQEFEPFIQPLRQAHPNIFTQTNDVHPHMMQTEDVDCQMVQYIARSMLVSIKKHLSENIFAYTKRAIKKFLILYGDSKKLADKCTKTIMFVLTKMPRIAMGPLREHQQEPRTDQWYMQRSIGQDLIAIFRPWFQKMINDYEHVRVNPQTAQQQQNRNRPPPVLARYLTPRKVRVILGKKNHPHSGQDGHIQVQWFIIDCFKQLKEYLQHVEGKLPNLMPQSSFTPGYIKIDKTVT